LGNEAVSTVLISAYVPCKPSSSKGETFWDQCRYFHKAKGNFRDPAVILVEDLLEEIARWRLAGLEVILALDANQNIYTGPLATALQEERYGLSCLFQAATGSDAPKSHFRGSEPIMTIFGSGGLTVGDAMAYPHWYGVGDHRVLLLRFLLRRFLVASTPRLAHHPAGPSTARYLGSAAIIITCLSPLCIVTKCMRN
jgi:hypothetical protein